MLRLNSQLKKDRMLLGDIMKTYLQVLFAALCLVLGCVFIELYDWIGRIGFFAIFLPINFSAFESAKAIFYPLIISGIIFYPFSNKSSFYFVKVCVCAVIGVLISLILSSPFLVFNNYNQIIKLVIMVITIISDAFIFNYFLRNERNYFLIGKFETYFTTFTVILAFAVFTFFPPNILLFH